MRKYANFTSKGECLACHTKCNARLREKGDAEVFYNVFVTARCLCAPACTEIFTDAAEDDVCNADNYEYPVGENAEVELCTADDEEEDEKGSGPSVGSLHKLLGEVTDVAEDGSEHHASKKAREADMYVSDLKLERGDRNGEHYEGDRNCHTLRAGEEESLGEGEKITHNGAENERKNDLEKGIYNHGDGVNGAGVDSTRNTEGDREDDKSNSVVKSNNGEENVGYGTLSFVLANDHKSSGRSGRGCNCTKDDSRGKGKTSFGKDEGKSDKACVHDNGCDESLRDTDNGSLLTDLFELIKAEFVTDGECDESEREIAKDLVLFGGVCLVVKADAELTEEVGADENARNEICGYRRESDLLRNTREKKTRKECD